MNVYVVATPGMSASALSRSLLGGRLPIFLSAGEADDVAVGARLAVYRVPISFDTEAAEVVLNYVPDYTGPMGGL